MGQRKRIAKEIREEILAKVKGGQKVVDLAQQYGISDQSIYGWVRQAAGDDVISLIAYNKLKRENEELKRLIGELSFKLSSGEKNRARS